MALVRQSESAPQSTVTELISTVGFLQLKTMRLQLAQSWSKRSGDMRSKTRTSQGELNLGSTRYHPVVQTRQTVTYYPGRYSDLSGRYLVRPGHSSMFRAPGLSGHLVLEYTCKLFLDSQPEPFLLSMITRLDVLLTSLLGKSGQLHSRTLEFRPLDPRLPLPDFCTTCYQRFSARLEIAPRAHAAPSFCLSNSLGF